MIRTVIDVANDLFKKLTSFRVQLLIFRLWLIMFDVIFSISLTIRAMDAELDTRLGMTWWSIAIGDFLIMFVGIMSLTSIIKKIGNAVGCK